MTLRKAMHSIAATITAPGAAAVSVTRISGEDSWAVAARILKNPKLEANKISLAWLLDGDNKLDHVLVLAFKAPHSYTGEDVIEIQSHGGAYISRRILQLILDAGAKLAKPGEFTERAFLNHKLDLSQAESIVDLIEARSALSSENAIKLYQGELGEAIATMRQELLELLGAITAGIDFPDEVGDYSSSEYQSRIVTVIAKIDELLAGENAGRILREGYRVALVGAPNAGKSSLLNTLVEEDRAIVTDIPGTTRDIIEESISIHGLPVVLVDTAGIRESQDLVEQLGIERSQQAMAEADLVIVLEDMAGHCEERVSATKQAATECTVIASLRSGRSNPHATHEDRHAAEPLAMTNVPAAKLIRVGSKLDLCAPSLRGTECRSNPHATHEDRHAAEPLAMTNTVIASPPASSLRGTECRSNPPDYDLCISTKDGTNISELKELIYERVLTGSGAGIKINERQADLLRQARKHLEQSLSSTKLAQDFWTIDLKSAIEALGQITGAVLTEQLLDDIFSRFCIGK